LDGPSRREARIARDIERVAKAAEKSARLVERLHEREARIDVGVVGDQTIPIGADPGSIFQMKMTWIDDARDCLGAWSSGTPRQWENDAWIAHIEPKLVHHDMPTDSVCDEAQLRLIELEKYADDIFRFRLGNKRRLWGFRIIANFEILWFDPNHEIYPTDPD
jgi:hypothetical protein